MTLFRLFLGVFLLALVAYTSVTITNHGINLFPQFFGDMAAMAWPGQFNLDFLGFLMLSALWVAWRHQFSAGGLALAVLAFNGGMLFLTIYLLVHSHRTGGNMKALLLGEARAG
ncbi:hypothetical protein [Novosphingobium sp.]|uniref:hypothetical protein n=1 Tax=Novosphingobium sp. TaxID=1874826 RepID=UPI0025E2DA64|nr:hypothetical protein [Novosphingobium sp.]MCC6925290.1 hypothetical protein [Novosphingobium sp.]